MTQSIGIAITVTTVEENHYCMSFKSIGAPLLEYIQEVWVSNGTSPSEAIFNAARTSLQLWQNIHDTIKRGNNAHTDTK